MALPHPSDTIAAIATAPGEGAIAVVRLSGPETYALADRFFRGPAPLPSSRAPGTFAHGPVVDPASGEILDDALLLIFRAPHSYTGEDSVEIQCHGGSQAARRILDALLSAGARQADPGEFTKRAFLNGKIDLTQAEAVLDLIHARSERAARLATAQLEDALGLRIRALYDSLLAVSADIEAMLDFPDDELPHSIPKDVSGRLDAVCTEIQALLDTWHEGHVLRDGARVVIAGAPNVGKSTLLNLLAGRDRAIVSPHPGTTRDTIEESIALLGYPLQLVDTAGLRDAPCEIEQEGIRRTHRALSGADLCVCLVDASQDLSAEEQSFLAAHDPENVLVLLNKIDMGQKIRPENLPGLDCLSVSLQKSSPTAEISGKIIEKVVQKPSGGDQEPLAISERHRCALLIAMDEVILSINRLKSGSESDFLPAATHALAALDQIGYIFGKNCTEEMLDVLFSRFCVGK
ncbi:MAG: tRNA uridine-5-carboxymethylaminomethyl(34) synthesis GTPase MnmE [Kiritimatiellia bacterium]